jgi:hypothetical protein
MKLGLRYEGNDELAFESLRVSKSTLETYALCSEDKDHVKKVPFHDDGMMCIVFSNMFLAMRR